MHLGLRYALPQWIHRLLPRRST